MITLVLAASFFFCDAATNEIYTLSLHDALPIWGPGDASGSAPTPRHRGPPRATAHCPRGSPRSEEHTSELQSLRHLVCRLLLEKKKQRSARESRSASESAPS